MQLLLFLLCAALGSAASTHAQQVPQAVLDTIISHEQGKGMKLERIIPPDFSQPAAPNHTYLGECYPARMLMVVIVMARKPADLVFKVTSVAKTPEVTPLQEFDLGGKKYWLAFRIVRFGKDLSDRSNHCLFVRSDDRADERLPIYQIFLTGTY